MPVKIVLVAPDSCYNDTPEEVREELEEIQQLSGTQAFRFCNESKFQTKRLIFSRVLGLEGSLKNNAYLRSIVVKVIDLVTEGNDVLVMGYCFGGMMCSKIADILVKKYPIALPRVKVVTYASLYLSPAPICTHFVIRGDVSNRLNNVEKLKKKQTNIRYIDLNDKILKKIGPWDVHALYGTLMRQTAEHRSPPDERAYRYCFTNPSLRPRSANIRQDMYIKCYDVGSKTAHEVDYMECTPSGGGRAKTKKRASTRKAPKRSPNK